MHLPIKVGTDMRQDVETKALLDSGAGGVFISHEFAERNGLKTFPLKKAISVRNVDGTPNKKGTISHYAKGELEVNGRKFPTSFLIAGLGEESVILGLPWLQKINLIIDWKKGTFEFREDLWAAQVRRIVAKAREKWGMLGKERTPQPTIEEIPDEEPTIKTHDDAEPIGPQDEPFNQKDHPSRQITPDALPTLSPDEEECDPPDESELDNPIIAYLRGKSALEIFDEELEPGDRIIAYTQGEPVIGIFDPLSTPNPSSFQPPEYSYGQKPTTISRILKARHSA